jgi:proline iminopeptidase
MDVTLASTMPDLLEEVNYSAPVIRPAMLLLAAAALGGGCTASAPGPGAPPARDLGASPAGTYFDLAEPGVRTGGVRMVPVSTPSGTFDVWTKRVGNGHIKVLLLHGGPAMTHEYFEAAESYFPAKGIEFYYYDQLGSYYSDQPTDPALWTIPRFVDEVEQVRRALGLEQFYLVGHSWGGILAIEYALQHQQHLAGLVISNMMASAPEYAAYNRDVLQKQMDPAVVAKILAMEKAGQTADPAYAALLDGYYAAHVLRLQPQPEPVRRSFKHLNAAIYTLMQGPSEFGISGRLETWDRKADLTSIQVPTLTIGAAHDTMDPAHMQWMATQVQQGAYLFCPDGSHMSMWDDQQRWFAGVIGFLEAVHERRFSKGMTF